MVDLLFIGLMSHLSHFTHELILCIQITLWIFFCTENQLINFGHDLNGLSQFLILEFVNPNYKCIFRGSVTCVLPESAVGTLDPMLRIPVRVHLRAADALEVLALLSLRREELAFPLLAPLLATVKEQKVNNDAID